jgi:hypothetical protein
MKDNGTIKKVFFDKFFAQKYNLIITKLDQLLRLRVINNKDFSAGSITYSA